MTARVLIGLDLGTTAIKAALYGTDGSELGHARRPTPWASVETGAEANPEKLFQAALTAIHAALDVVPGARPVGIGVTSMAESGVLLDRRGQPLWPFVAWHDTRAAADAEELANALGRRWFAERTGLILRPRVTAAQVHWLLGGRAAAARASTWLGVAEWVAHRLGAEPVAELSLSARTGLLDLAQRRWLPEVTEWAGLRADQLPELVPAGRPIGSAGSAWPRLAGAPITLAGHDHLAAAVGAGVLSGEDTFDSCGTAEALVRAIPPGLAQQAVGDATERGIAVGWHVLPEQQILLGGMPTGRALTRLLRTLGIALTDGAARRALDAAALLAAFDGELELDGIMDQDTPLEVPTGSDQAVVWRSALAAVTGHARGLLTEIERIAGPTRRLVAGGGWTHSRALLAEKRRLLGDVAVAQVDEPGARGAALLAGVAAGLLDQHRLPAPRWELG